MVRSQLSSDLENVHLIAGDGFVLKSHQVLLGAGCSVLKSCLLDPGLVAASEDQVLILCPDYSQQDLEAFLRVLYGEEAPGAQNKSQKRVKSLLQTCGYDPEKIAKDSAISALTDNKLEVVIKDEDWLDSSWIREEEKENPPKQGCYPCPKCPDATYKYRSSFDKHYKKVHEGEPVLLDVKKVNYEFNLDGSELLTCNICSQSVMRSLYGDHQEIHHQITPIYHCELCSKEFRVTDDYRRHLKVRHHIELYPELELCGKCSGFTHANERQAHLELCKKKTASDVSLNDNIQDEGHISGKLK